MTASDGSDNRCADNGGFGGGLPASHQAQFDSQKLIEYKIDKLSERVDKHNSVVERTYKLEQDYAVVAEQIKVANHRLTDLEVENEKRH